MSEAKRIGSKKIDLVDRLLMLSQALPPVPCEHWRCVQEAIAEIRALREIAQRKSVPPKFGPTD